MASQQVIEVDVEKVIEERVAEIRATIRDIADGLGPGDALEYTIAHLISRIARLELALGLEA
jgi:hypothetical protein